MKSFITLGLAIVAVVTLIYAGYDGLVKNYSYGAFVTFIGMCTAIGVGLDVRNQVLVWIRKGNVRKLGR